MRLCKIMLAKQPAAETPISKKKHFSAPSTFSFKVKMVKDIPNKKKMRNGNKKSSDPLTKSLTVGIKNSLNIKRKEAIRAQKVISRDLFIILSYHKNRLSDDFLLLLPTIADIRTFFHYNTSGLVQDKSVFLI